MPRLGPSHPLFCDTNEKLLASGSVDNLISVFLFEKDGVFQSLAHALKYDGFDSVGVLLGKELGMEMDRHGITDGLLVPIPLHSVKLRERGFNQAEAIAKGVSEVTRMPVVAGVVTRKRATQTQTKLGIAERQKNVEDAFSLAAFGKTVEGRDCILIDDVITTGATIASCARTLREAGASRIVAASTALAE